MKFMINYYEAFDNKISFMITWIQKFKSPRISKKYICPPNLQFIKSKVNKTK